MYIMYNPNPIGRSSVGDCVIRAVSKALDEPWENSYIRLCISGFAMGDLPNADIVFGAVLRMNGFKRQVIPDTCPECYTVEDFAKEHPIGTFVLGLGGHVTTIVDGDIYDTWDTSREIPVYYWYKENNAKYYTKEPMPAPNPEPTPTPPPAPEPKPTKEASK